MILVTNDKETQTFGELKTGYMFKDDSKIYVKLTPHPADGNGGWGMCMTASESKKFKNDDVVIRILETYHNEIKPEIVKETLQENDRIHLV